MTDTTTQAALRLLEITAPARRWYVMRPDESAYCMEFSYKHEADAWMRDQADYVARNGYVLREHAWPGEKHKLAQTLHDAIASLTAERDELQAQVEALRASITPISVKDRLPPKNVEVFVFFAGQSCTLWTTGQYTGSQYDKHGWCYPAENNGSTHNGDDPMVTHWLPMEVLPSPDDARKEGD